MGKLAVQEIRKAIEQDSRYRELSEQKEFQSHLEDFLDQLDAPRTADSPDGYVEIEDKNYRGILNVLDRFSKDDFTSFGHPIFQFDPAYWRKKILHTLFPIQQNRARDFLIRHDLLSPKPPFSRNYDACLLPKRVTRPLQLESEILLKEFEALPSEEKLKVVASLLRFDFDTVHQVLQILFPDFKTRKPDNVYFPSNVWQPIVRTIQSEVDQWRKNGHQNSSEVSLKILARLVYTNSFLNDFSQNIFGFTNDVGAVSFRNEFYEAIKDYYEPVLWDTDFDGTPDSKDPFPTHMDYARDLNENKIPDEAEEAGLGPDQLYGLIEEEYKDVLNRLPDGSESSIGLYRHKNQVYLILHIPFDPAPEVAKEWPFRRYLVKRNTELYLAEATRAKNIPITILLNPYPGSGKGVEVVPGDKIDEKIAAYSSRWPINHSEATGAHEGVHQIPQITDRYASSPYVKYCRAFSPGLIPLWNKPHLMNVPADPELDEVDFIPLFDQASSYRTLSDPPPHIQAEIFARFGKEEKDLVKIIALDRQAYQKYALKPDKKSNYFESNLSKDDYQRQLAAKSSLRGVLLDEIERYQLTKEPKLFEQIQKDLGDLKIIGKNSKTSAEAAEALMDAKILEGILAKNEGNLAKAKKCFQEAIAVDDPFNKGEFARFKISLATRTPHTIEDKKPKSILQVGVKGGGVLDFSSQISLNNGSLIINDRSGVATKAELLAPFYTGPSGTLTAGLAILGKLQTNSPTPNRFWAVAPLVETRGQLNLVDGFINLGLLTAIGPQFGTTGLKGYWEGMFFLAIGRGNNKGELEIGPSVSFPNTEVQLNIRVGYRYDVLKVPDWLKKVLRKR